MIVCVRVWLGQGLAGSLSVQGIVPALLLEWYEVKVKILEA